MRWIQRYVPDFERRWNRFACRDGASWRVDETYVKIKGRWTYLYRAVDKKERLSISCSAPSGMSRPRKRFYGGRSSAKADCRIRSRSMATRHHIGRPKRFSANIPDANKARSGLRTT